MCVGVRMGRGGPDTRLINASKLCDEIGNDVQIPLHLLYLLWSKGQVVNFGAVKGSSAQMVGQKF